MLFLLRRLVAALALVAIVPSLTFLYFAATYSNEPVLPGLKEYLESVFLHLELDGALAEGRESQIYYLVHEGVPVDIALMAGGMVIGVGLGALGGLYLAAGTGRRQRWLLNAAGAIALCAPAAVTAYAFVFFFGATGGDHPVFFVTDAGTYTPIFEDPLRWLQGLWVPWLAIALPVGGAVMRVSAGASRDALSDDSVRTAWAKGVKRGRVLRRHVFVFAVPPVAAYSGAAVNLLILNAAIVERIFNLPGSFRYVKAAIDNPNVALLQTMALITVLYVVVGNLLADLAGRVDPRTR